ncbi:MAG: ABC transporter ATP-binding protein [Rubellimicrobium sp.]|nr:ABC transporter ATP-binding protein [Rubellimicrobium sp.]
MTTKLKATGLSKSFGELRALDSVDLHLEQGDLLAVLGASGCGKTTLLRCIAGFETPDTGRIEIDRTVVFDRGVNRPAEQRKVGYVPQGGVLFPHLSAARNIGFGLKRGAATRARVEEMLALVGMAGLGARMPHELSGGQQQRVALARALAPAPSLVLLDEPFSALDAGLRVTLREEVTAMLKSVGASAIIVTHDQEEALSMADHVMVMRDGVCVQLDDPVSLYRYPSDLNVATFLGDATLVEGSVCNDVANCPLGALRVADGCPRECKRCMIMIRPEQITLGRSGGGLRGRVEKTVFYGHDAMVHLRLDDEFGGMRLKARVSSLEAWLPDERVEIDVTGEVMVYDH